MKKSPHYTAQDVIASIFCIFKRVVSNTLQTVSFAIIFDRKDASEILSALMPNTSSYILHRENFKTSATMKLSEKLKF